MARAHVIGAGMAGLSAALRLTAAGRAVTLHEAAAHAGGRCRSFRDDKLGLEIDNGNHLLLSGNTLAMRYLNEVGAAQTLYRAPSAAFPFVDLDTGRRWTMAPNRGHLPWWIFSKARRVPETNAWDYLSALKLPFARRTTTITDVFNESRNAYKRFWEPLSVAVLNTRPHEACARMLWPVLAETFGNGEAACRPCIARDGLSDSFVAPALETLKKRGAEIEFGRRLRDLGCTGNRVDRLGFADGASLDLMPGDAVVLAVPSPVAAELLPGLNAPREHRSIANAHFALDAAPPGPAVPFLGLLGGTAEWLFQRGRVISVTISAAEHVMDRPAAALARSIWTDVAKALDLPSEPIPAYRIIKEKRATFAATAESVLQRPGAKTRFVNLALAGDWTDTGLPSTIEGAIRSGATAARTLLWNGLPKRGGAP